MPIVEASQKKTRKPQKRSVALREGLLTIIAEYEVMTVRQLYYQAEMRGLVGKDEADYDKVQYHCLQMRRDGAIPYYKITDSSRDRRIRPQYDDMATALFNMHSFYRRNYWREQPINVEIWCEKDALTGIISPICAEYGVTYVAVRGFDSESLAYETACAVRDLGKPTHIYYFGDHDPSGWWIANNLQGNIRKHGADVTVFHHAVHPAQVWDLRLPVRKAKTSDSRRSGFMQRFGSDSCTELDAIPPNVLGNMVRQCIEREIEPESWFMVQRIEQLEKETLGSLAGMVKQLEPGARVILSEPTG
jgi:hypothetical protein